MNSTTNVIKLIKIYQQILKTQTQVKSLNDDLTSVGVSSYLLDNTIVDNVSRLINSYTDKTLDISYMGTEEVVDILDTLPKCINPNTMIKMQVFDYMMCVNIDGNDVRIEGKQSISLMMIDCMVLLRSVTDYATQKFINMNNFNFYIELVEMARCHYYDGCDDLSEEIIIDKKHLNALNELCIKFKKDSEQNNLYSILYSYVSLVHKWLSSYINRENVVTEDMISEYMSIKHFIEAGV